MLKPQLSLRSQFSSSSSTQTPSFLLHKPFVHGNGNRFTSLPRFSMQNSFHKKNKNVRIAFVPGNIKAVATSSNEKPTSVKAIVTVKLTVGGFLSDILVLNKDDIIDWLGKTLLLELVSAQLDPNSGLEKETIKGYAQQTSHDEGEVKFESDFEVPSDFGEVGAIFVENERSKEMYLKDITLNGFPNGPVNFTCDSWVHSKDDYPYKRVFFANKATKNDLSPRRAKKSHEQTELRQRTKSIQFAAKPEKSAPMNKNMKNFKKNSDRSKPIRQRGLKIACGLESLSVPWRHMPGLLALSLSSMLWFSSREVCRSRRRCFADLAGFRSVSSSY